MKRKRYSIIKILASSSIVCGIITIYGTAGSSDIGVVTIKDSVIRCLIGVAMILIGTLLAIIANMLQNNYNNRIRKNNIRKRQSIKFIRDMNTLEVSK